MFLDMTSAAAALTVVLVVWFIPLVLFFSATSMRGTEKFSWALMIAALTWPGYAIFLFLTSGGGRHP